MIKGIFFDFDGVLFNTEAYYNKMEMSFLDEIDSPLPRDRMKMLICADTSIDIFDEMLKGYEDQIDKEEFKKALFNHYEENPRFQNTPFKALLFEDVPPILKWLKENDYKIACASRSNQDYLEDGLGQCDILDYFDVVTSGANFKKNKPDPECYLYCLEKCGLKKEECLIIEDSPNGIKAAHNAGIRVVVRKDHEIGLDQSGGDYYVENYDELKDIIKKIDGEL